MNKSFHTKSSVCTGTTAAAAATTPMMMLMMVMIQNFNYDESNFVLSNENVSPSFVLVKKEPNCSSIVKISGHKLLLTRNE